MTEVMGHAAGLLLSAPGDEETVYALIQRGPEAKNYHWHWDLPGGSLRKGETLLRGALREAREEAGIGRRSAITVGRVLSSTEYGTHVYTVFEASSDVLFPLVPEDHGEVAGCGWFTAAVIRQLRLHPHARKELEAAGFWDEGCCNA